LWPGNTERRVSSVQRPPFTQLCARRNGNLSRTNPGIRLLYGDGIASLPGGRYNSRTMFEIEIYARGLREMGKILELDRQLVEIAGLRYKVDANHDIVYLEFDEPTLSVREIRTIFLKLSLEPLFIGAIPPELQSRTKTERLNA